MDYLACRHDLCIGECQCRHISSMHLLCRNVCSIKLQITCGNRVMHHGHVISKINCSADGGIKADMTHGTKDRQLSDAPPIQKRLQFRIPERIGMVLEHNRLPVLRQDALINLRANRSRNKERRIAGFKLVPDMDDRRSGVSKTRKARQGSISTSRDTRDTSSTDHFREKRRPRYLFSGLRKCGCCGGGYSMISGILLGCSTPRNKGTCDNRTNMRRDELERRVLNALRHHLMAVSYTHLTLPTILLV